MLRILLHAVVLTTTNLGSIIVGYVAYKAIGGPNQLAVQVPTAVFLSIGGFAVWSALAARLPWLRDGSWTLAAAVQTYVAALVLGPALFAALHFASEHYVTSLANLVAVLLFQIPTNLLAVGLGFSIAGHLRQRLSSKSSDR